MKIINNTIFKRKVRQKMIKELYDYMKISYPLKIVEDKYEGGFVVSYPDLPGCITCGGTLETALENAIDAKKAWFEAVHETDVVSRGGS